MTHRETEVRHGPPLRYVADKIEASLHSLHFTARKAELIPDDVTLPEGYPETFSVRGDVVERPVEGSISDLLKAFLSLLDLDWWSGECVSSVMAMSGEEFEAELRRAWEEGSLIGANWPQKDS